MNSLAFKLGALALGLALLAGPMLATLFRYGEFTAAGTSWLYLSDRPFTEIDLPALSDESPAEVTETIQHGIFRGFSGPIMLFGLMSVLMKSSGDKRKEMEDDHV